MNIEKLFELQQEVDNAIAAKMPKDWAGFGDWESLAHRKFAFRVEVMELANEIGFFKDWKHSHEINLSDTIEELADCIAFLLSIGITQGYDKMLKEIQVFDTEGYTYEDLFDMLCDIQLSNIGKYTLAFSILLGIGTKLGATLGYIAIAYAEKSKKNKERQEAGY